MPDRGDVWLANLEPRHGTEPGKTRPVLVVQAQALLSAGHPSTLVVPLTTRLVDDAEPLRVRVRATARLRRDSDLLVDQLRAIDNRRLVGGPMARLSRADMVRVGEALRELLDLEDE
ncbi:MAG TPA: type II toxin-antitoxin system PemK/MazF family toxin [Vicinamibacteria bacterium]|nr:type II toxin-antitoxin system PemK/MazF family toxin [Vicinamibacteria bacterium]